MAELVAPLYVDRFSLLLQRGTVNVLTKGDESVVLPDKTNSGADHACRMFEWPANEAVPRNLVEHVEYWIGVTIPGAGAQGFLGSIEVVLK
ncbi:hypothetical protein [Arthrobacter monumenti]